MVVPTCVSRRICIRGVASPWIACQVILLVMTVVGCQSSPTRRHDASPLSQRESIIDTGQNETASQPRFHNIRHASRFSTSPLVTPIPLSFIVGLRLYGRLTSSMVHFGMGKMPTQYATV